MAATEKAIKIAPKSDPEIKAKVSKKLNRKFKSNLIAEMLLALMGVLMIIPCSIYAILLFIGMGFKAASEGSIRMYNTEMRDMRRDIKRGKG